MPEQEDKEDVLWPYGTMVATLTTVVWMIIMAIVLWTTTRYAGWPGPGMRVVVITGLAFYGCIPLLLTLLDRIWVMIYGSVERNAA